MSVQTGRDDCYICGRGHTGVLETHHIVPSRYGGGDETENLVDLCPSCHTALEKLYNKRFYNELGAERPEGDSDPVNRCTKDNCYAIGEYHINGPDVEAWQCEAHYSCGYVRCDNPPAAALMMYKDGEFLDDTIGVMCEDHRICSARGCEAKGVDLVYNSGYGPQWRAYCTHHSIEETKRLDQRDSTRVVADD